MLDARERPVPLRSADEGASIKLARALRAAGDSRAAIQIYRRLQSQKNAPPGLQIELGETLMDAGMIDDAIGVFLAIPSGSPNAAEAQLGLARAQLALNKPGNALEYIDRAASLAQNDVRILVVRGIILDCLRRHSEAQTSYRAAMALAPRSVAARNNLALSLVFTGQYKEAIALLTPIARSVDASARERQNLALVLGLSGDAGAALALSRVDLDEAKAQANTRFFAFVNQHGR